MKKTLLNPSQLPSPRGFNHGILVEGGRLLFLSGQDACGADGRIVAEDLCGQFRQILRNLKAVVAAAGGSAEHITKLNIFVRSRKEYLANLKPLGQIYREECGSEYPAMALFEVSGFFNSEAVIELEGLAVVPDEIEPPCPSQQLPEPDHEF